MKLKRKVVMLPTNEKATDTPFSVGVTLCNDGELGRMKSGGVETHISEILKVDKNNYITIESAKDSWNLDEHCTDMQYYMEYCISNGYVTPMKWLNELKHY